ncbi:hypothetical protein ACHAWF_006632 [Thalassiosira exigua]
MIRFKASMEEWKRKGGRQGKLPKKRTQKMAKIVCDKILSRHSNKIGDQIKKTPQYVTSTSKDTSKQLQKSQYQQPLDLCPSFAGFSFTMEEMNKGIKDGIGMMGDEEVRTMWGAHAEALALEPALEKVTSHDQVTIGPVQVTSAVDAQKRADVRTSDEGHCRLPLASNEPVDIEDNEIINMWNESDHNTETIQNHCLDDSQTLSIGPDIVAPLSISSSMRIEKSDPASGVKSFAQTMSEVQQRRQFWISKRCSWKQSSDFH